MSQREVSTLFVIVIWLKDVIKNKIRLFVFDIFCVRMRRGKLLRELSDAVVDVRNRRDAHNTRVSSREERLDNNHVVRHRLLVLDVDAVELRIRSGRFLHRLRILALLRHLVSFHNLRVIAPAVEIARTLREIR